jgi:prepilin-type processing-associated H-X9-DG protein
MKTFSHFNCDNCGKVNLAFFDGHLIGDRVLEGVDFGISIETDGSLRTLVAVDDIEYMKSLHMDLPKWNAAAVEFAAGYDVFECGKCRGECDLIERTEQEMIHADQKH